jgi:serine/threonine-protein kinase
VALKGKHGAMLAGRYRLLEQLGEGGMGSVWKAEHLVLRSHVAIKIIDPDAARFEFNLARFLREAKTLASLRSPNVVQVLDFGSDVETPYLVMELLEGQTLGRRLTRQGRLSLSETSRVLEDVCAAMALVHEQGLIHRDLKPENIFLCDTGEELVTKIVDFGIAKSLRPEMSSMKTRTGHMLGTPSYMSPEQCRGLKDIDHRADLWALGVIAYECIVGKVPFEGEVLGDLLLRICMDPLPVPSRLANGVLPSGFDAWFAKAVARNREVRFQSALELSASLIELSVANGGSRRASKGAEPARRSAPQRSAPQRSAPQRSAPAASPSPAPFRQPPNTLTNTTVGLGGITRFKGEHRTWLLSLGAVALAAALGVWVFGKKTGVEAGVNVGVQNLRPPFEATPKVLRRSVPTGRRWTPSLSPEDKRLLAFGAAAPHPAPASPEPLNPEGRLAAPSAMPASSALGMPAAGSSPEPSSVATGTVATELAAMELGAAEVTATEAAGAAKPASAVNAPATVTAPGSSPVRGASAPNADAPAAPPRALRGTASPTAPNRGAVEIRADR